MKRSERGQVASDKCRVKKREGTRRCVRQRTAPDPDPFLLAKDFGL